MKVLVIDLSYYVFYRYYALTNYFKLSQKRTDFTNIVEDTEFINKYTDLFEKNVLELVKKHLGFTRRGMNKASDLLVIFAKDCCRDDIWRNAIHPEYKQNRDHQKHAVPFDGRIFDHVMRKVIPSLVSTYNFMRMVESCGAEADDIAAVICRKLYNMRKTQNEEDTEATRDRLIVITNDHDYLQLLDAVDGIYNLQGQDLSKKGQFGPSVKNMYVKALAGDPSDNIVGVMSKKEVKLLMMEDDPNVLETMIRTKLTAVSLTAFERNKRLINFEHIPEGIKKDVEDKLIRVLTDLNMCGQA